MKPEGDRLLTAFCQGKVITQVEFPAPGRIQIRFASGSGIEISEPKAEASRRGERFRVGVTAVATWPILFLGHDPSSVLQSEPTD